MPHRAPAPCAAAPPYPPCDRRSPSPSPNHETACRNHRAPRATTAALRDCPALPPLGRAKTPLRLVVHRPPIPPLTPPPFPAPAPPQSRRLTASNHLPSDRTCSPRRRSDRRVGLHLRRPSRPPSRPVPPSPPSTPPPPTSLACPSPPPSSPPPSTDLDHSLPPRPLPPPPPPPSYPHPDPFPPPPSPLSSAYLPPPPWVAACLTAPPPVSCLLVAVHPSSDHPAFPP